MPTIYSKLLPSRRVHQLAAQELLLLPPPFAFACGSQAASAPRETPRGELRPPVVAIGDLIDFEVPANSKESISRLGGYSGGVEHSGVLADKLQNRTAVRPLELC